MATDVANPAAGNGLRSRRWLLVAPTLLFLWIIAQIDKTNVSLIIADTYPPCPKGFLSAILPPRCPAAVTVAVSQEIADFL